MEQRTKMLMKRIPIDFDGVIITSSVDRFYFTGMRSSAGTLLIARDGEAFLIIDSRYFEKAKRTARDCTVILQNRVYQQLDEIMKAHNIKRLGIETEYMSLAEYLSFQKELPDVEFIMDARISTEISKLRMIKSSVELDTMRAAQKITDDAFTHICGYIKAGMTDRQIAGELLDYTFRHGSQRPSFEYIVVSGVNSSMPHGVPTDKIVEAGDFITMDFGCTIDEYCSDMTRTVAVGHVTDEMQSVYDTVLKAQIAGIETVKAGIPCKSVDAAAREIITNAGYGECFGHGTGHSLGIEIHEPPNFNKIDETLTESGMVLSMEPGIYIEGRFGVRIEDVIMITQTGCEVLTKSEKKLLIL